MAAEIGTMRVTDQIDALTTLSTDPLHYLVVPRLLAGLITLPLLVLVADIIGVFGGYLVGVYKLGFNPAAYLARTEQYLETSDVVSGLVKAAVFGFIVALMGCYHGYHSRGGAQGVGQATTYAVVSASILILVFDYVHHPGVVRAMSGSDEPRHAEDRGPRAAKILRPQPRARRHRHRLRAPAKAWSSSAARAPANRCWSNASSACCAPTPDRSAIDGAETTRLRRAARERLLQKFGMLFQGSALFDSLRGVGECRVRADPGRGMERQAAKEIALAKLAAVGLGREVGELRPAELSGGMQKRVALARAIAAEPEIIFFDEPTTGLDPIMADVINDLILKCVRDLGATAVSITHDMVSARKIADRIAMLHKGRIIWHGPAAEIDRSGNPFVDQFIHGRAEGPIQMEVRAAMIARPPIADRGGVEPMARAQPRYVCQQCGAVHAKWTGRCDGCGAWNSLVEELPREALPKGLEAPAAAARSTLSG